MKSQIKIKWIQWNETWKYLLSTPFITDSFLFCFCFYIILILFLIYLIMFLGCKIRKKEEEKKNMR